ncbi:PAS domain S-box protein [Pseudohalocynthiibacter sp. F2068]|jgi:PAS domain S-box-containing protein|uniref:PAS domain S-box protein n=1 Tax=Pseudohalocynthiibacter sp. F2068 TaxID=2926418 RepID=UPI001FF4227A|nr:PAS domain S-box protein [Pseudohalocynthiibacter sp. F2068]MCK0103053.1 PAS domain S-box protein [Pseudohalocynthiibacter sp. F2068]
MTNVTAKNEALLDALLNAAVDAIIVSDETGNIIRSNPAASKMFGYEPDEILGLNVRSLMPDKMAAKHGDFLQRYLETRETSIIGVGRDLEGQKKDGSIFPVHLSIGSAEVGRQVFFVGVLHDLTERKNAETALNRSQRLEAIGQLTGGVAHDFNNLLTVVIGNLELLEPTLRTKEQSELLNDALESAEHGADLIHRLLAFARRSPLAPVPVDISVFVDRVGKILARTIGARYDLNIVPSPNIWHVHADPAQLQTAILNLAFNAQDAMPDGGKLVIETSNIVIDDAFMAKEIEIEMGRYVRLSVTDTGHGMSQAELGQAFEPFFTTKPARKGTGLGLSMVYGFVKQSGGHVALYSEPGQGTTVNLYLPASDGDAVKVDDLTKVSVAGNGQTILAVEDNPAIQQISLLRLEALNYNVIGAADAAEALEFLADRSDIDLMFTDLVMPGDMTGYDLAKTVHEKRPRIKILLTSGYAEDLLNGGTLSKSGFRLLRKPYRQADIAAEIHALLSEDQS